CSKDLNLSSTQTVTASTSSPPAICYLIAVRLCIFTSLLLSLLTSPSLIHIHLHPLHRLSLVQLRRFRNQFLQRRLLHIRRRPHLHMPPALPRPFQQPFRVRPSRPAPENERHMFLPRHKAPPRPVRIKRRNLPRIHIFFTVYDRLLHQCPQSLQPVLHLSRLRHILVDPRPPFFSLNRRHRSPPFRN